MNIVRRPIGGMVPSSAESADPFRMMRELSGWDPFRAMLALETRAGYMPDIDVRETPEAYVFHADLPGFRDQDVEVSVSGNRLTLSGKREEEKRNERDKYYSVERTWGSFTRSFTLPDGVDTNKSVADLKNGVLTVSIPRAAGTPLKKIPIGK